MRSQLFGFVVQSHVMYELLLTCPLEQAVGQMKQHLVEQGALISEQPATRSRLIHYLDDPLTVSFETFLSEWDEEVVETVHNVNGRQCRSHERLRMEALKSAVSWLWPKLRQTTVLAQFAFAVTIDNETLLTATIGWNEGALPADRSAAAALIPRFLQKLERMGFAYRLLSTPLQDEKKAPPPAHKPRLDTLQKLQKLVAHRARHLQPNYVGIDKMQACADVNIALKTVKKYAPILCDRWYDATYAGDVQ